MRVSSILSLYVILMWTGCVSLWSGTLNKDQSIPVHLPPIQSDSGVCYFLDQFMPTPDSLATGKQNGLYIRHYTYFKASVRFLGTRRVTLSFYSHDQNCWSLYERQTF